MPGGSRRFPALPVLAKLVAAGLARPARAAARLEVAGSVQAGGEALEIRVVLTNLGDEAASGVSLEGELLGATERARLDGDVSPGQSRSVDLRYPLGIARAGLHALILLIDYSGPGGESDFSQRAYLLIALGGVAEPVLRISAPELELDTHGTLRVELESLDGETHRVLLSVETPRALRVLDGPLELEVPASGSVSARVVILRGVAPPGSEQGILVVAKAVDGDLERTSVTPGLVRVVPRDPLLARLRRPLLAAAVALLAGAAAFELRRYRRWSQREAPTAR